MPVLEARLQKVTRLAVLGAGSVLRADDAAGIRVVENLQSAFSSLQLSNLLLCIGETAPENYSGKIKAFAPSHLLLVDAANLGTKVGEIVEINPEDVGGPTFCSHMLPLRVMIDYIRSGTELDVVLLGIQSQSLAFDGEMTPEVAQAVEALSKGLCSIITERLVSPK